MIYFADEESNVDYLPNARLSKCYVRHACDRSIICGVCRRGRFHSSFVIL